MVGISGDGRITSKVDLGRGKSRSDSWKIKKIDLCCIRACPLASSVIES